jgi:branched-chain amino acid transport system substrate-binding protein
MDMSLPRSKPFTAALAITTLLMAAACGGGDGGGDATAGAGGGGLPSTIKIGVPLDVSGSAAVTGVGTAEKKGVDFAVKQINDSGFLGDTRIEPVHYDTQVDKTQAVTRTTQLISRDKVSAIVGYTLTPSFMAAAPLAQKAQIPVMAVGLSGFGITDVGDYMHRELLDYRKLFDFGDPEFVKATGAKTAAYLYGSDTETTSGQFDHRRPLIEGLGVKTVEVQTITAASTDMRAQLTAIKNAKPDLLVINVVTGLMPTVLVQAGEVGIDAQILADNSLGSPATLGNPPALKGAECGLYAVAYDPASTAGANPEFVSDWKAANGGAGPDLFNALGRDAMWAMASAMKQAGSVEGPAVRDALRDLKDFSGALGDYNWDKTGQPTYQGVLRQIQKGVSVAWTPQTPACTT